MVKVKEVKGLLVNESSVIIDVDPDFGTTYSKEDFKTWGLRQGEREFFLDREATARWIFERCHGKNWDKCPQDVKDEFYKEVDDLNVNLKYLLIGNKL